MQENISQGGVLLFGVWSLKPRDTNSFRLQYGAVLQSTLDLSKQGLESPSSKPVSSNASDRIRSCKAVDKAHGAEVGGLLYGIRLVPHFDYYMFVN